MTLNSQTLFSDLKDQRKIIKYILLIQEWQAFRANGHIYWKSAGSVET